MLLIERISSRVVVVLGFGVLGVKFYLTETELDPSLARDLEITRINAERSLAKRHKKKH